MSVKFGISGLPPTDSSDVEFLDQIAELGYRAFELAFVKGFSWKSDRCQSFGRLAESRGISLSLHAPYFAVLTVEDPEKSKRCLAAIEHSLRLGYDLGATVAVVHPGPKHQRDGETLVELSTNRLEELAPKVSDLGVNLGLETAGKKSAFGTLGDLSLLCREVNFTRPVVDWAHLHALSGGGLTDTASFQSVFDFLADNFPDWMLNQLHTHFTANHFGPQGEIRHARYGTTDLRIKPMLEAAGIDRWLTIISESREEESHHDIFNEVQAALSELSSQKKTDRKLDSGLLDFPRSVRVCPDQERWRPASLHPERSLTLSNIDKPLFAEGAYTKGDLITYYAAVAEALLPHLADRPLSMSRYPDGITGNTFYEKRAPSHHPEWMHTITVPSSRHGEIRHLAADSTESLLWFANMGCIEVHPFHSRSQHLDCPDYAIFDLDPAPHASWEQVVWVGQLVKIALDQLGLRGYPKLSGSLGLHIYCPLDPVHSYGRVHGFVDQVGRVLSQANPEDVTVEWQKSQRKGKVFIDSNRNAWGQTVAAVYSIRPYPTAPISAPLRWEELDSIDRQQITMGNIWERLQRYGELFAPVFRGGQTLDEAEKILGIAQWTKRTN